MKQYYVYRTTNKLNGKMYIGSHYGEIDDDYLGSGLLLSRALEKHGKENFLKEVLDIQSNKQLMLERESYWLTKLNCAANPQYYNITNTAGGGHLIDGKTKEEQQAIFAKGAATRKPKQKLLTEKMVQTRRNWSNKRKQDFKKVCSQASKKSYANMTPEQKVNRIQKILETKKNLPAWKKEITSKKRAESMKKRWDSLTPEQRKAYGKRAGGKNKGRRNSEIAKKNISEGVKKYILNMSESDKIAKAIRNKIVSNKISNLKWCNDGINNYRKTTEEINLLGYKTGRVTK